MSIKLRRITSPDYGINRNNTNFSITIPPELGIIDISRTTLCLDTYLINPTTLPFDLDMPPHTMIKNIKEITGKYGTIATQNDANQVNTNFFWYLESRQQQNANSNLGGGQGFSVIGNFDHSRQSYDTRTVGADYSQVYDGMMSCGSSYFTPSVPLQFDQKITEHSVFNRLVLNIPARYFTVLHQYNTLDVSALGGITYNIDLDPFIQNTFVNGLRPRTISDLQFNNTGSDIDTIVVNDYDYQSLNDLKYNNLYVDAMVTISWLDNTGTSDSLNTIITGLNFNSSNGSLEVQLNDSITGNPNALYTQVKLSFIDMNGLVADVRGLYSYTGILPDIQIHNAWFTIPQYLNITIPRLRAIEYFDYVVSSTQFYGTNQQQSFEIPNGSIACFAITNLAYFSPQQQQNIYSMYGGGNVSYQYLSSEDENSNLITTIGRRYVRYPAVATKKSTTPGQFDQLLFDNWCNRATHNHRLRHFYKYLGLQLKRYDSNLLHTIQTGYYDVNYHTGMIIYPYILNPDSKSITFKLVNSISNDFNLSMVFVRSRQLLL